MEEGGGRGVDFFFAGNGGEGGVSGVSHPRPPKYPAYLNCLDMVLRPGSGVGELGAVSDNQVR